jgi:hypothetical protein
MHIFMDESGSFTGLGRIPSPSTVGTLVIPDSKLAKVERAYARLRHVLPTQNGEVKGKLLSEVQVADVVEILRRHNALFEVNLVELGAHTGASVDAYRAQNVQAIRRGLTPEHSAPARTLVERWCATIEAMSSQLYVQSVVASDLVIRTFQHATLYYCQRTPRELGAFNWVIDAKEKTPRITPWETWWSEYLLAHDGGAPERLREDDSEQASVARGRRRDREHRRCPPRSRSFASPRADLSAAA